MCEECCTECRNGDIMSKEELERSNAAIDRIIQNMEDHKRAEKYINVEITVDNDGATLEATIIGEEHMTPTELNAHLSSIGLMAAVLVAGRSGH